MTIDYDTINKMLLHDVDRYLREWLPGGKVQGNEYLAYNPKREDKTLGSFTINRKHGRWMDGATGDKGSDLISLYAYLNDVKQNQAARALFGEPPIAVNGRTKTVPAADNEYTICLPVPEDAPPEFKVIKFDNGKYYKPSMVHTYTDANGVVLRFIYRFDAGNGLTKKEFRPLTCWRDKSGKLVWRIKDIPDKRPLYGLEALAQRKNDPVLVVSGEKCVDAVKDKIPGYVVITWSGGDNGAAKTDFSPLKDRAITWWPDNDYNSSCKNVMLGLAKKYGGRVLNFDTRKYPDHWDCADAVADGWGPEKLSEFINNGQSTETAVVYQPIFTEKIPEGTLAADDKGKVEGTIENFEAIMKHYRLAIWTNEMTNRQECSLGDMNVLNSFYARVKSVCSLNNFPRYDIGTYLDAMAEKNKKNPVGDWIKGHGWERGNLIQEWIHSAVCDYNIITLDFQETVMFKWLLSACAAALREDADDFRARGVLVLQGAQGIGKTTFLRNLCGADWGGDRRWFGEGLTLDPGNKDSIMNTQSFWIVELAEFENTLHERRSLPALKAFLTNPVNTVRRPYAKAAEMIWGRTAYAGSVNQMDVLTDVTGNSRFWFLPVLKFKDISHINMQQVWAEAYYFLQQGMKWYLTGEEEAELAINNKSFMAASPVEDLLANKLDWCTTMDISMWERKTCTVILKDCGMQNPTQGDARKAGYFMRDRLGMEQAPKVSTAGARFYPCPPLR